MSAMTPDRLRLLDALASGDSQHWADLFENPAQQQIAEAMYGQQADALLSSSWLAERDHRIREEGRQALAREVLAITAEAKAAARRTTR